MTKNRLLFVTRNYPPQVGGMERFAYDLYHALSKSVPVDLLKHSGGRLGLPVFILRALLFLLFRGRRYTHIHFGDAVLAPLAVFTKVITAASVSTTVHALDVIYPNPVYQFVVPRSLARLDRVVAVSHYTKEQCIQRGVDAERICVIPNGIFPNELNRSVPLLQIVANKYGFDHAGKHILFSVGRLIPRKGIRWFVDEVMPALDPHYLYLIAGTGPERDAIAAAIRDHELGDRVHLLGRISDEEKFCLYRNAQWFIMPNVPVAGDAEGFGITLIEAAASGLPVIAARVDGIPDAVIDGVTGKLVEPSNRDQYAKAITEDGFDRNEVSAAARSHYDWAVLKERYLREVFS